MTRYVYLLSDYAEDGAENVVATLDRDKLLELLESNWSWERFKERAHRDVEIESIKNEYSKWLFSGKLSLGQLLEKVDSDLCEQREGWNLHDGWGGVQLHVVRLE